MPIPLSVTANSQFAPLPLRRNLDLERICAPEFDGVAQKVLKQLYQLGLVCEKHR
jgi:hypothetical protein